MNPYRLITHDPANGIWNMAVDEAVLESVSRGDSKPTLRLYAWQPGCLSLGYSQTYKDVDLERLKSSGGGLVRRLTGGKAIMHIDELTYSVIAPIQDALMTGTLLESYNRIARGLLQALRILGLPAEINALIPGTNTTSAGPVCFEVPSAYEITVNGKKLIGSAQARRKLGVLQHGSLPLFGDLTRITNMLKFDSGKERQQAATRLLDRAATVESILGVKITWETAARAFTEGFKIALDLELEENDLSDGERERAKELINTRYAQSSWTERI